jgi:hypothetical protein
MPFVAAWSLQPTAIAILISWMPCLHLVAGDGNLARNHESKYT